MQMWTNANAKFKGWVSIEIYWFYKAKRLWEGLGKKKTKAMKRYYMSAAQQAED